MTAPDPLIGKQLGPYRIDDAIAEGGMGSVYRGTHVVLHRPVAIKTLHAELATNKSAVDRFFAEARAVNLIGHENIVECTDFVSDPDGTCYMVMELLQGQTVGELITEQGRLPPGLAVNIASQITAALGAAHEKQIVHRDLKPGNVLLIQRAGSNHYVKVLDFGVARLQPEVSGMEATQTGMVVGTPMYMSPEQINGGDIGPGADIYALGALLFHMLSGRPPFEGTTPIQVLTAHITQEPAKLSEIAGVPEALSDVVARALAKEPADRYQSMKEMNEALLLAVGGDAGRRITEKMVMGSQSTLPATGETDLQAEVAKAATGERAETRRSPLLLAAIGSSFAALGVVAWILFGRGDGAASNRAAGSDDSQVAARSDAGGSDDAPPDSRATADSARRLQGALAEDDILPLPERCLEVEPPTLALLADAAASLRGGRPGHPRPEDSSARRALEELSPPPDAGGYWYLLARARLIHRVPVDDVVAAAAEALARCPGYAPAELVAGTAYLRADRLPAALERYRRAAELAPGYGPAHHNLGIAELQAGDIQKAIASFTTVLERAPENGAAYALRGRAHLLNQQTEPAISDLERAAELTPDRGDVFRVLGLAHKQAGNEQSATEAFCTAAKLGDPQGAERCPTHQE